MSCQQFLEGFIQTVQRKSRQVNQASWLLETTGSSDAARLKSDLRQSCGCYSMIKISMTNWSNGPMNPAIL